ncbi:hypothetical protein ACIGC1_28025 [Peribacillus butanolivorans]|uniref:hypothetical protein n=1 Tax=Peribacillus butanolivorans TaxID=421767 RepID=UPI0037C6CC72
MKFSLGKNKVLAMLLALSVVIIGCSNSEVTVTEDMDQFITDTIIEEGKASVSSTDKQFEAHNIFGTEEKDGLTNIYLHTVYEGYDKVTGGEIKAGFSYPVLIKLAKEKNVYVVKKYRIPEDGAEYTKSIEEMFPKKYAKKAINNKQGTVHKLEKEIQKEVDNWLNSTK